MGRLQDRIMPRLQESRVPRTPRVRGWQEQRKPRWRTGPGPTIQEVNKAIVPSVHAAPDMQPWSVLGLGETKRPGTAPLPPSVRSASPAPTMGDPVSVAYHWKPVQMREHKSSKDNAYTTGTFVDTLSMNIASQSFAGAPSHMIRVEANDFRVQDTPWCYVVGGSFVCCKGVLVGTVPSQRGPERGRRVARLPAECRPEKTMHFAALAREAFGVDLLLPMALKPPAPGGESRCISPSMSRCTSPAGESSGGISPKHRGISPKGRGVIARGATALGSSLVTLVVTPDGWVTALSAKESQVAVDLSAIRFCIGRGTSLIDSVTLHTVDVGGTRMVTLQGALSERFFNMHGAKPLALLPECCQPTRELQFIVPGASPGGFHLVNIKPSSGMGVGGELSWGDSLWNHDQIQLTGIMYSVSGHAMACASLDNAWSSDSLKMVIRDFQAYIVKKYGSIEEAWQQAFDVDGSGLLNFTSFTLGCKITGFCGSATRLWAALDTDRSGNISMDELFAMLEEGAAQSLPGAIS